MRMTSFVVTIGDFFLMETTEKFPVTHQKYVIPKYQREYKWTTEKVKTLITDINNRDKFLGNIILNKVSNYYEIVDGQQRITTILLILIALFNKNKLGSGTRLSEEQRELRRYLIKNDHPILENESIGEYINFTSNNEIQLSINDANDIYYQKSTFEKIYGSIIEQINSINDLISFQKKILDCQILVLIGLGQTGQNDSIEDIFMDINFKSQLLDVADIFKGYCFKNYAAIFHNELKQQWTIIRKYIKEFKKIGYNDNDKETCQYLYHYLLSRPETYKIPSNLSFSGKHYLDGKNNTETKLILIDMGNYGENIINFTNNLERTSYKFENICNDASHHLTENSSHEVLRKMLQKIILNPSVQYYKFPLFMFLHYLLKDDSLKIYLSYSIFKKFVTNYYAYSFFFISDSKNKNKSSIDHTILDELYNSVPPSNTKINSLLSTVKNLRNQYLGSYKQFVKFDLEKAYALYSLMDNYISADNFIKFLYDLPDYNKEHFILHANSDINITWKENNKEFIFSVKSLFNNSPEMLAQLNNYRKSTANYIILPANLNSSLDQKDIVTKISAIKNYYSNLKQSLPKHVNIFISHIESNEKYILLKKFKTKNKTEDTIKIIYKEFINEYFSNESQRQLYEKLEQTLRNSFQNKH